MSHTHGVLSPTYIKQANNATPNTINFLVEAECHIKDKWYQMTLAMINECIANYLRFFDPCRGIRWGLHILADLEDKECEVVTWDRGSWHGDISQVCPVVVSGHTESQVDSLSTLTWYTTGMVVMVMYQCIPWSDSHCVSVVRTCRGVSAQIDNSVLSLMDTCPLMDTIHQTIR